MSLPTTYDFDFESLRPEKRTVVREDTLGYLTTIQTWQRSGIETGEWLIRLKKNLDHGEFGDWLRAFFPWSEQHARNLMQIAKVFKSRFSSDLQLAQTAMIMLSPPSIPESARQEALTQAANGQHVGTKEAQAIIDRHRASTGTTDLPGQGQLFDEEGPGPEPEAEAEAETETETEEDEEESSPPPPPRPVDLWKSDRILKHVRSALDRVDDVTRAVTAKEKNGGYGGIKASLARLTSDERLRLRAELENLIERLLRWTDQIEEKFDEAGAG